MKDKEKIIEVLRKYRTIVDSGVVMPMVEEDKFELIAEELSRPVEQSAKGAEEKKKYVCGFLFNTDKSKIVLIRKNKPEWQKGKLNGVGGKIEIGETPLQAMHREAYEEMGCVTNDWNNFLTIEYKTCIVHFFKYSDDEMYDYVRTRETEVINKFELKHLPVKEVIPNLNWIINLALDPDISTAEAFEVPNRLHEFANQQIVLPGDIELIIEKLSSLQDEGPVGVGWQSDELIALIERLKSKI